MARTSKRQDATVERVMHEFKEGELTSGSGDKVKSRRQAIAIALSESGESNRVSPAENRKRRRRTAERGQEMTKAELYAEAKEKDVPGRSTMSKAALAKALGR